MELIGTARFVMLGTTAHGTHEFSRERGEIIKRLIQEKGFTAIAIEADWPAPCRADRYVRGPSNDDSAVEALGAFSRFQSWLWRNTEAVALRVFVTDTIPVKQRNWEKLCVVSIAPVIGDLLKRLIADRTQPEPNRKNNQPNDNEKPGSWKNAAFC